MTAEGRAGDVGEGRRRRLTLAPQPIGHGIAADGIIDDYARDDHIASSPPGYASCVEAALLAGFDVDEAHAVAEESHPWMGRSEEEVEEVPATSTGRWKTDDELCEDFWKEIGYPKGSRWWEGSESTTSDKVIYSVTHWLRTWAILQKPTSQDLVAVATQRLAQVVKEFFTQAHGWQSSRRIECH
ncbi:unnamed protein product [Urochloa humidicola]